MSGHPPRCLALFQPRIEGDEALLELAAHRFRDAGLGPEYYAASPEELAWLLRFKPWPEAPTTVHLARDIDLLSQAGQERFLTFARRFSREVYGFVLHDRLEMATQSAAHMSALTAISSSLGHLPEKPLLFIEYAVGLGPDFFCSFMEAIAHLDQVSACLDIGHLGIHAIQTEFKRMHPELNVCAFTGHDPHLPDYIDAIEKCVRRARPAVLKVISRLAKLNKPLHFHLHDGHPLSSFSPFGVADHLSFLQTIPLAMRHQGKKAVAPMFGPMGLSAIVKKALEVSRPDLLSFTLEIHPTNERAPLLEGQHLFQHWQDKTNAEKQNHWLTTLLRNHALVQKSIAAASPSLRQGD